MEVERAIVDLYRTFLMKKHVGERFEGTVTAVVGSGLFVQLDEPFVDVLVRLEDLGPDRYEVDDDGLRVVAGRSGDVVALGDRLMVEVVDAAILRRTVYAKRVGGEGSNGARGQQSRRGGRREPAHASKGGKGGPSSSKKDPRHVQRAGWKGKKTGGNSGGDHRKNRGPKGSSKGNKGRKR